MEQPAQPVQPGAPAAPVETAEERRKRQMEGVPDLPPLLAQILKETRERQQRAKERAAAGLPPEEEEKPKGRAPKPGEPLLLEGPGSAHLVTATHDAPIPKEASDSEDSDDDAEPEAPPGPPDAARCRAHGPGFSGSAAGQEVSLTVTCRDAAGKRVREGGAHILVMVEPVVPPGAAGEEPEAIEAEVTDHGNGTYTAAYAVPTKGNYQLHIEVNGEPLGNSPFPIFFSAPAPAGATPAAPAAADGVAAPAAGVLSADAIKAASQQGTSAAGAALAGVLAGAEAAALGLPAAGPSVPSVQNSLGFKLAQLGLRFPPTLSEDEARRLVVVGGVPVTATPKEIKPLFEDCGTIRACTMAGPGTGFAFVEFSREKYAARALALEQPTLMGQPLQLELAADARKASESPEAMAALMSNPLVAMQIAQRQQFQLMQQQQAALAEQVAAMRAAQRTGVAPLPSQQAQPPNQNSQMSAALAAAVALSKKLAGGGAAPVAAGNGGDAKRDRSRSRSRDRSRRERRRSRSRSRDRRRDRRRSRSRSRDRRSSRERRSGRDRERDGSRDRRRRRSRSGSGDRRKHRHRHSKRDRRSRSRDRKNGDGKGGKEERGAEQGAERMDVDAAPEGKAPPKDELEELLEELGD